MRPLPRLGVFMVRLLHHVRVVLLVRIYTDGPVGEILI